MPTTDKMIANALNVFRPLGEQELDLLTGGGHGPWEVKGTLDSSSNQGTNGSVDLSYHFPKGSVTGSLATDGHSYETGLAVQGQQGKSQWSGGFATNGHDWSTRIGYSHRF